MKIQLSGILGLSLFFVTTCDEPKEQDTIPPEIAITSPQNGSIVSDIVTITCISIDNEEVEMVELWVDDSTTGITDDTDPYSLEWNTKNYEDGEYSIFVRSYDNSGNTSDSDTISLTVDNECDTGYVEIDSSCYWGEDIQFLQILIDNSGLEIGPLELGDQTWVDGRITRLRCWSCDLSGEIPPEIGNMSNLEYLHLSYNQLSGEIPSEIGNLSNIYWIDLQENQLSGEIPPEIGNMSILEDLYLGDNQLRGEIPTGIGNLSNLQSLYLFGNQLSGEIPPEIGNMSNLEYLDLSHNQLSGEIPPEIGDLSKLDRLWLADNQLSGLIPDEICNLNLDWSSPFDFLVSGNYLCPPYPDCIEDFVGTYQDTTGCD